MEGGGTTKTSFVANVNLISFKVAICPAYIVHRDASLADLRVKEE